MLLGTIAYNGNGCGNDAENKIKKYLIYGFTKLSNLALK